MEELEEEVGDEDPDGGVQEEVQEVDGALCREGGREGWREG